MTESGEFNSDRRQSERRGSRIERSPARKHFLKDTAGDSLIGQKLGAYTIVSPIGHGGMGSVGSPSAATDASRATRR